MPKMKISRIDSLINEYHQKKEEAKVVAGRINEIEIELDAYMEANGLKRLETQWGLWFGFSEIDPTYSVSRDMWDYLLDLGLSHEELCTNEIDREKLVPYIKDGTISEDKLDKYIVEVKKGYRRHSKGVTK
jgi:hypothetical protein